MDALCERPYAMLRAALSEARPSVEPNTVRIAKRRAARLRWYQRYAISLIAATAALSGAAGFAADAVYMQRRDIRPAFALAINLEIAEVARLEKIPPQQALASVADIIGGRSVYEISRGEGLKVQDLLARRIESAHFQ